MWKKISELDGCLFEFAKLVMKWLEHTHDMQELYNIFVLQFSFPKILRLLVCKNIPSQKRKKSKEKEKENNNKNNGSEHKWDVCQLRWDE